MREGAWRAGTRILALVAVLSLPLAAGGACAPSTWRREADRALGDDLDTPEAEVRAGELALLGRDDPDLALRHLGRALDALDPASPLAGRAALAIVLAAGLSGTSGPALDAIARVAPATADPDVALLLVEAAAGGGAPLPAEVARALVALASRHGAAWEPVRAAATRILFDDAAGGAGDPAGAAGRAGVVRRWRVRDGDTLVSDLPFSDGEVHLLEDEPGGRGFVAEAVVAARPGGGVLRAICRVESNRSFVLSVAGRAVLAADRTADDTPWTHAVGLVLPAGRPVPLSLEVDSPDGHGFARLRLTGLDGPLGAGDLDLDAADVASAGMPLGSPHPGGEAAGSVLTFPPPPEPEPAAEFRVGDGAGAVRALLDLQRLLARPGRDLARARDVADRLAVLLPDFFGLDLLQTRLDREDRALPASVARGRRRASLERALERRTDSVPALLELARVAREEERRDEALGLLRRAEAARPDDPAVLSELLGLFVAAGWEADAIEVARKLEARADLPPEPLGRVGEAWRAFFRPEEARRAGLRLERVAPDAGALLLAMLDRERDRPGEAAARLEEVWSRAPERIPLASEALDLYREAGDPARARDLAERLVRIVPRSAAGLGAKVELALDAGDEEGARRAIEALLEARPGALRAERLGAWLAGRPGPLESPAGEHDEGRARVERFRREGLDDLPGTAAVTLLDETVLDVRRDGTVLQLERVVRVVLTRSGADALGEIAPPDGASLLVARTLRADGTELWPERTPGKRELSLPGLQPGDAIEVAWVRPWRADLERGALLASPVFAAAALPVLEKRFEVRSAAGVTLVVEPRNGAPAPAADETLPGGGRRIAFSARDLQLLPSEPSAPPLATFAPRVDVVAARPAPSWERVSEDHADRVRRLARPGPHVRRALREALPQRVRGEAALRDLSRWVREQIDEAGGFGDATLGAETAVHTRRGSRAAVLAALAIAAGEEAEVLLCAPEGAGARPDPADLAARDGHFVVPVVRFPFASASLVDPSNPYAPFGLLPEALRGAACLPDDGGAPLRLPSTPPPGTPHEGWDFEVTLRIDGEGNATGTVEATAFGPETASLRQIWMRLDEAKRRLFLQEWLARTLQEARVESVDATDLADSDRPFAWRIEVVVDGLFQREGDRLRAAGLAADLWAEPLSNALPFDLMTGLPRRATPLLLRPHAETVRIVLVPPDGADIETDLPAVDTRGRDFSLAQTVTRDGRRLEVRREARFDLAAVPPADYPSFRQALVRAREAFARGIELRP